MNLLLKASEEKDVFYELIGSEVTFAIDIISVGGWVSHKKGDKAIISEVVYSGGYWSNLCADLYVKPAIGSFRINNVLERAWLPGAFEEFRK